MKKYIAALSAVLLLTAVHFGQDPTPDDAKTLREIIAERNKFEALSIEYKRQADVNLRFATEWQGLYEAEKDRADRVQGGQVGELRTEITELKKEVGELRTANGDLFKSNAEYKTQSQLDGERLKDYERKIASLKTQRWIFMLGGAAAGGLAGYKFGKDSASGTTIVNQSGPVPPPMPSFKFSVQF